MKWADLSEFFVELGDFFPTLENYQKIRSDSATYLFLRNPPQKCGNLKTDIVYIGKANRLGGKWGRLYNHQLCRSNFPHRKNNESDETRIANMEQMDQAGCETRISWVPCCSKETAISLEDDLLNAFVSDHGCTPKENRTQQHPNRSVSSVDKETLKIIDLEKTTPDTRVEYIYSKDSKGLVGKTIKNN